MRKVAEQLADVVNYAAGRLLALTESEAAYTTTPEEWSKKQIVGHLIDSAANNHQRFLRAAGANPFTFPNYDQPFWVGIQNYQGAAWRDLVELWRLYNLHLAHVIPNLPGAALRHECTIGTNPTVTLAWIVSDYRGISALIARP